jgi:hypothetical protein
MPLTLATQEDLKSKPARANSSTRTYLEKLFTKIGLVDWLKLKFLSSSPSISNIYMIIYMYIYIYIYIYIYNFLY